MCPPILPSTIVAIVAGLGLLLDDVDLYPDEILSDVARRLGFGEQFDDAVGLTSA